MATFAKFVTACETAFWPEGTFLAAYGVNAENAVDDVLEADVAVSTFRDFMAERDEWEGTMTQLHAALTERVRKPERDAAEKHRKAIADRDVDLQVLTAAKLREAQQGVRDVMSSGWPKNPQVLSGRLKKVGPQLRKIGIEITWPTGRRQGRKIFITTHSGGARENVSSASSSSSDQGKQSPQANENSGLDENEIDTGGRTSPPGGRTSRPGGRTQEDVGSKPEDALGSPQDALRTNSEQTEPSDNPMNDDENSSREDAGDAEDAFSPDRSNIPWEGDARAGERECDRIEESGETAETDYGPMTVEATLGLARSYGVEVRLNAAQDGLRLEFDEDPPQALVNVLRRAKWDIVAALRQHEIERRRPLIARWINDHFVSTPPDICRHCGEGAREDDVFVRLNCGDDSGDVHASCQPAWREAEEARAGTALGLDPLAGLFDRHFPLLCDIEEARPDDVDDAQWDVAMRGLRTFLATGGADEALRLSWPKDELFRSPAAMGSPRPMRCRAADRRSRGRRYHAGRDSDQGRLWRDAGFLPQAPGRLRPRLPRAPQTHSPQLRRQLRGAPPAGRRVYRQRLPPGPSRHKPRRGQCRGAGRH